MLFRTSFDTEPWMGAGRGDLAPVLSYSTTQPVTSRVTEWLARGRAKVQTGSNELFPERTGGVVSNQLCAIPVPSPTRETLERSVLVSCLPGKPGRPNCRYQQTLPGSLRNRHKLRTLGNLIFSLKSQPGSTTSQTDISKNDIVL